MPLVFRKIRQSRWLRESLEFDWLLPGEFPGDPLGDLATTAGALSIYLVDDNRSNLERVAAAIATQSLSVSPVDYVLTSLRTLEDMRYQFEEKPGVTADNLVNTWHRDIVELSATRVLDLAQALWMDQEVEIGRIPEKKVARLIVQGVSLGNVNREGIKIRKSDRLWREIDQISE